MKNIKIFFVIVFSIISIFIFAKIWVYSNEPEPTIVMADIPVKKIEEVKPDEEPPVKANAETSSKIPGVIEWKGTEPYPLDWSGAVPELKVAVDAFQKKWGAPLSIRQVYRPIGYMHHMRSVWEVWRYTNGKTYTQGYQCEGYTHLDTKNIGTLTPKQKELLNTEAKRHGFVGGDTPPGCVSDHAKGIAIDITPPFEPKEYQRFMEVAHSVGLCHYIKGDEPHFGLTAQLPANTDCFQK